MAGVAWAPTKGIDRVELSIDEGPWIEAELSVPLSDDAWVQWKRDVDLEPGDHTVRVRATDGTGFTQPGDPVPPQPNGAEGWHTVRFTVNA